jgi:hydroxymethylpyrimidine/phosphomethylpyrimidine kinase
MAPPRILTIAGSDPSGGAGLQADIKTITMLGGYAMSAVTAITVQNTRGVTRVEVLAADLVAAQIEACLADIGADAVKIGMLGSAATAHRVADILEQLDVPVVFDPVMVATSGGVLADPDTVGAFGRLMALAALVTPNLPELAVLAGFADVSSELLMGDAAEAIMRKFGARAILAKGGHWPGGSILWSDGREEATDHLVFDVLYEGPPDSDWREMHWEHPRLETRHTHGTGCTLASAIATGLGAGLSLSAACGQGIVFVQSALAAAPGFGQGHGPLGHQAVRGEGMARDEPTATDKRPAGA